ncbi:sensor histidine kinase [Tindallia californiensis]|uniref:Two-component system, sensor histidine kinase YesM n=1 Tax=Tindallia californiensis TaxID=159292 RepID=A0A1H3QMR0_9FIRM|nr:histidine kinase [Tindallia californiensis]SDZ14842.1 two-component system, sensor histidine kinase YesM [Tindallia californiensis]
MKRSIRTKIIAAICITFLILLSLFIYVIEGQVKERVNLLNRNLTNQLIDARGNQISNWLEQRKIELEMMASFILKYDMSKEDAKDFIEMMYEQKSDTYVDMGIVEFGGYKRSIHGKETAIKHKKYYKDALKENASFKISEPQEVNGDKMVAMLYKVGGVNREIEFIYAEVPLEGLMRIASRINVYDGSGEILIKNKSIDSRENLYPTSLDNNPLIFETDIKAARGWSLNYYISAERINAINRELRKYIVFFQMILLASVIVLLMISFESVVKPIDKLKEMMGKVEKGDLSVRLQSHRKDEIGSLITSFNNMTQNLEEFRCQEREMKLKIMQEQVKPHFLYNTLDTIKWVATEENTEEVLSLIDALGTYFRIGLSSGKTFISLDEELEHIDSYLRILKARYEDRLVYSIHYDDNLLDVMVMRVLLQPIVENAVIHGINQMTEDGKITIYIASKENEVVIKIMNNAVFQADLMEGINNALMADEKTDMLKGYGLYSVNHRIKLEHGEQYGLELQSKGGWTIAVIRIPIIRGEKDNV